MRQTQAPDALVAMSFFMTMSVSAQSLYDVCLPTGQVRPVSVNSLVIAQSGERKTAVDSLVSAPIQQFDAARIAKHEVEKAQYERDLEVWQFMRAGLRRRLHKQVAEGESEERIKEELAEYAAEKPVRPRLRYVLRQNVNERSLMDALEGQGESIGFISDEGEVIIKGGILRQPGMLNKMWDGASTLSLDRSNGVNVLVREPRLTLAYMVQPVVFQQLLERRGENLRGSGHWARFLVGWPTSRQGSRHVVGLLDYKFYLPKFHATVTELLNEFGRQMDEDDRHRTTLVFSEEAKEEWVSRVNEIETLIDPWGGELHEVNDFASKTMEIISRVAALLHIFSKQEGEISLDTFNRALQIVRWHLYEFKRIFTEHPSVPQEQIDAIALENYLHKRYWCNNHCTIPKNAVLRNGPIRTKIRFDVALSFLIQLERVYLLISNKTNYIYLNPTYFGNLPRPPIVTAMPLSGTAGNY